MSDPIPVLIIREGGDERAFVEVKYLCRQERRIAALEAALTEIRDRGLHHVQSWHVEKARTVLETPVKPIGQTCAYNHPLRRDQCIEEAKLYTVVFKDGRRVEKYLCAEAVGEYECAHSVSDVIPVSVGTSFEPGLSLRCTTCGTSGVTE